MKFNPLLYEKPFLPFCKVKNQNINRDFKTSSDIANICKRFTLFEISDKLSSMKVFRNGGGRL